jgi:hypothetical protein
MELEKEDADEQGAQAELKCEAPPRREGSGSAPSKGFGVSTTQPREQN